MSYVPISEPLSNSVQHSEYNFLIHSQWSKN